MAWNNSFRRAIPANEDTKWNELKFRWFREHFETGKWQRCIGVGNLNLIDRFLLIFPFLI
jgi:hypothetical protein